MCHSTVMINNELFEKRWIPSLIEGRSYNFLYRDLKRTDKNFFDYPPSLEYIGYYISKCEKTECIADNKIVFFLFGIKGSWCVNLVLFVHQLIPSSRPQYWVSRVSFLQHSSSTECIHVWVKINFLRRKELKECSLILCPGILVKKAKYQWHLCLFDTFSCNWPHNFVLQKFLHYIFRYSTGVWLDNHIFLPLISDGQSEGQNLVAVHKFIFFLLIKENSMIML